MAKKTPIEDAVTNVGAAELVGTTEGTIRRAIREGELHTVRTADGKVALLPIEQVKRWAAMPRAVKRGRPRKSEAQQKAKG